MGEWGNVTHQRVDRAEVVVELVREDAEVVWKLQI
jgi:hypothetical protein